MRSYSSRIKFFIRRALARFLDIPTIIIIRLLGKRLYLTYDNTSKGDGLGAQAQRVFGIFALSKLTGTKYIHTGFSQIAVHPLDPYQEKESYIQFLKNVNDFFQLPSDDVGNANHFIELTGDRNIYNRRSLIRAALLTWSTKKNILFRIREPYFMIDSWQEYYRCAISSLSFDLPERSGDFSKIEVVVHYRWGVGGMAIQSGEKYPRELPLDYYFRTLERIKTEIRGSTIGRIKILTDAPLGDLVYAPPQDQIHLWVDSPSFHDGQMSIKGGDFGELFANYADEIEVIRGGSALDAIKEMMTAEILIMSKSSLSYVSGLLNPTALVYYPSDFWHPRLNGWRKV